MTDSEEQVLHFYKTAAFTIPLRVNILGSIYSEIFSS